MPTYIALLNWTERGAEQVESSPARLDAGRQVFQAMGVEIKDVYMTMGRYDLVCTIVAPDDATLAKAILTLGMKGTTKSETLKAFPEDEYRKIIGSLS
jgi:uncharacterized protein with GYD domain